MDYKIDAVLIHETPHVLFDYIFCKVSNFLKIDVFLAKGSIVPWMAFLDYGTENSYPYQFSSTYIRTSNQKDISRFLHTKTLDYTKAIPSYEKQREDANKKRIWNWKNELKRNIGLLKIRPHAYFYGLAIKYKSYSYYTKNVSVDILNERVVSFFLHFQPERTTLPEGGVFNQQIIAIRVLRSIIPVEIPIVVKEHPSTYRNIFNQAVRPKSFYPSILKLSNTHLCPWHISPFELIDNSIFTVTINGTVGIESVCRGVNSVYFGNAHFKDLTGTFHINQLLESEDLVNSLLNGDVKPAFSDVEKHVQNRQKHAFGTLHPDEDYYDRKAFNRSVLECFISFLKSC